MNHSEAIEQMVSERYSAGMSSLPMRVMPLRSMPSIVRNAPSTFVQALSLCKKQRFNSRNLRVRRPNPGERKPLESEISGFPCGALHLLFLPLQRCSSWWGTKT